VFLYVSFLIMIEFKYYVVCNTFYYGNFMLVVEI